MDQTHFNTWKEIDDTYQKLQVKNDQPQEQDKNGDKGHDQDHGITKKPKVGHQNQAEQKIYQQLQNIYLSFIRMLLECLNQST